MKKFMVLSVVVLMLFLAVGLSSFVNADTTKTITITAWTVGPDIPSSYRYENLTTAASRLNQMLESVGSDIRVKVTGYFDTVSWDDFLKKVVFGIQSGQPVDIICTGHDLVASWADAGYLLPLDTYVKQYWDQTYSQILPSLWPATQYDGKIYAIPQDTEARPLYVNIQALKKLGWTDEQINNLPNEIYNGDFTLNDLINLAIEAQQKGYVKWGFYHRPVVGVDFFELFNDYHVPYFDSKTDNFVFSQSGVKKVLTFFYNLTNVWKITPKTLIGSQWNDVYKQEWAGEIFAWMGGTWNWAEGQQVWGLTEQQEQNLYLPVPLPAVEKGGKPVTLSHPMVYVISKNSKNPALAFLLITLATAPDLNLRHDLNSGHLPIEYTELGMPAVANNYIMQMGAKMLAYTSFEPNSIYFGYTTQYNSVLFDAISAVESGQSVDAVESNFLARLKALYPGHVTVEP